MTRGNRWNILRAALAWIVGLVFIYAAAFKIADPADFAQNIKYYKILPLFAVNAVAIVLPWWEITSGLALFLPGMRRTAAIIVICMTSAFIAAVISALIRGLDISCGCFGPHSGKIGATILAVDLSIIAATVFILWHSPRRQPATP